jgi:hypothetical protein
MTETEFERLEAAIRGVSEQFTNVQTHLAALKEEALREEIPPEPVPVAAPMLAAVERLPWDPVEGMPRFRPLRVLLAIAITLMIVAAYAIVLSKGAVIALAT